jgi:hypothetical protein
LPSDRSDPFAVLGLSRGATVDEVRQARNRLAKEHHPDVGGTAERMQALNDAAAAAIGEIETGAKPTRAQQQRRTQPQPQRREPRRGRVERDHPSFTIEALPAEAFEALAIAARILGDVADDEPPYRIDMVLDDPWQVWCRAELVPDGGGSTVSLTVVDSGARGGEVVTREDSGDVVTAVRDRLLDELNALDWTSDGPRQRPPS